MKNLTDIDIHKWQALCEKDSASTFFHTPSWYDTACQYLSCQVELVKCPEDSILPTIKYRRGLRRRVIHQSSPFGTYGGILGDRSLSYEHLESILRNKRIFIRSNPYVSQAPTDLLKIEKSGFTQVLNIPFETNKITDAWSSNHVRSLQKAKKENLLFSIDSSASNAKRYYKIYAKSMGRFGKNKTTYYTDKLFDIISKRCKENTLFCFVSHDNIDVSAGVFFVWKHRIHYWSGANTEQGLKLGAPVFMFHNIIKHCIEEGIKSLDFNPSNNLKGVIQFKSKFGSIKLPCTLNSSGF